MPYARSSRFSKSTHACTHARACTHTHTHTQHTHTTQLQEVIEANAEVYCKGALLQVSEIISNRVHNKK